MDKDRSDFLCEAEKLLERNKLQEAFNLAGERLRSFPADADAHVVAVKRPIWVWEELMKRVMFCGK